jgi:hypothetical protein
MDVPVQDPCEGRMPALEVSDTAIRDRLFFQKREAGKPGVSLNSLALGKSLLPAARETRDRRLRSTR